MRSTDVDRPNEAARVGGIVPIVLGLLRRKIAFGTGVISFSGTTTYQDSAAMLHGLGRTPLWGFACQDFRTLHGDQSSASIGPRTWDATAVTFRGTCDKSAYAFSINVNFFWFVIG